MKYVRDDITLIETISPAMGGVFSIGDLENLLKVKNRTTFFNRIKRLQKADILSQFKRGFYVAKNFNPDMLCARIDPNSYISMGTVLSRNGLIGTMPVKQISAVRIGRNRKFQSNGFTITYAGISKDLVFGIEKRSGINYADNEKAFLDVLYYYLRGYRYPFDPFEISLEDLDRKRFYWYLANYKNEKFQAFCEKVMAK